MDLALFNCTCGPTTKKSIFSANSGGSLLCVASILKEKTDRKRRRKMKSVLAVLVGPSVERVSQENWLLSLAGVLNTLAKFEVDLALRGGGVGTHQPAPGSVLVRLDEVVNDLSASGAVDTIGKLISAESPVVSSTAVECLSFLFRLRENAEAFMGDEKKRAALVHLLRSPAPCVTRMHAANALAMAVAVAWDCEALAPETFVLQGCYGDGGTMGNDSGDDMWRPETSVVDALVALARMTPLEVEVDCKGDHSSMVIKFLYNVSPEQIQFFPSESDAALGLAPTVAMTARSQAIGCLARIVAATCRDAPGNGPSAAERRSALLGMYGEALLRLLVEDVLSPTSLELAGDECLGTTWQAPAAVAAARALACLCHHTFPGWHQASAPETEDSQSDAEEDDFVLVDVANDIKAACSLMEGGRPGADYMFSGKGVRGEEWTLEAVAPSIFASAEAALASLQRRCKGKGAESLREVASLQAVTALLMDCVANLSHSPAVAEKLAAKGTAALRLGAAVRTVADLLDREMREDPSGQAQGALRAALCDADRLEAFHSCIPAELVSETESKVAEGMEVETDAILPQTPTPKKPGQKFSCARDLLHHTPPSYASMLIALANLALFTSTSILPEYFRSAAIQQADVARQRGNDALYAGDHCYARWWYNAALRLAHSASAQAGEPYQNRYLLWSNRAESCLRGNLFVEALHDAQQALNLQPDHVKSRLRCERARQGLGLEHNQTTPLPLNIMAGGGTRTKAGEGMGSMADGGRKAS